MRSRDDISLAGVVHDLNNVFQTLVGVAMQLESEPELAAAILRCVGRGQNIASALSSGSPNPVPFTSIVANAHAFLDDFQKASKGTRISIEADIDPSLELAGHWAWERVLINLFLNSARAMPGGGTIFVSARRKGSGTEIRIADEGCGIAQALLPNLFEPHISGNGSSGLGLSVVDNIVRLHGGQIVATNRTDASGAEFVITLRAGAKAKSAKSGR